MWILRIWHEFYVNFRQNLRFPNIVWYIISKPQLPHKIVCIPHRWFWPYTADRGIYQEQFWSRYLRVIAERMTYYVKYGAKYNLFWYSLHFLYYCYLWQQYNWSRIAFEHSLRGKRIEFPERVKSSPGNIRKMAVYIREFSFGFDIYVFEVGTCIWHRFAM